jgi:Uma2 family endonuclease
MIELSSPAVGPPIVYPESDGLPMADNTKQMRWIVVLYGNLAALHRNQQDVFVAGNLFWYPVEGHPEIVVAPDVLVVFGRPKGDRASYRQWVEANIPVTVAFEVLSPRNTVAEMADKLDFYDEHDVEEYYLYDPETARLLIYLRRGSVLQRQRQVHGFVSPRLGIRFDLSGPELTVYGPDQQPFLTFEDLRSQFERERQERLAAEQRAGQAELRATRLAELGRKARRQETSAEELAELERLEQGELPGST